MLHAKARRSLHRGFTLIELLVVISIIAVLLSLLLSALGTARENTRRAVCMAKLHQLGFGLHVYADDHHSQYLPQVQLFNGGGLMTMRDWMVTYLEKYSPGMYTDSMFCPNLNSILAADYLQPWTGYRYSDVDGDSYYLSWMGYAYLANRLTGPYTLSDPIHSPTGPFDPGGWVLAVDKIYGNLDGLDGKMIEVRAAGHVRGGGGIENYTDPIAGAKKGGASSGTPAGGNQLYNDGHVEWVDASEMRAEATAASSSHINAVRLWRND